MKVLFPRKTERKMLEESSAFFDLEEQIERAQKQGKHSSQDDTSSHRMHLSA
jgi:hypothetical protein